jgi:phosphonate transport system substrate-binding protein
MRFGAVSFYNPRVMYLKYQPVVDYLSEHTPYRWELVVLNSYEQTVDDLCSGGLSMAYLGPLTYVLAHARCGALPLVRLNTGGSATYQSLIMVRRDSTIASLAELAGRSVGFGAPLSTSSHLMPRWMLLSAGLKPGTDVRCVYYGHHERAARAVTLGEVDACGIRDIVGRKFEQRGLRVLAASPPMPNFPLAVAADSPQELRQAVIRALVVLPETDPAERHAMAEWDEELSGGFTIASDDSFDPIRRLARFVFGGGYLTLDAAAMRCGEERP